MGFDGSIRHRGKPPPMQHNGSGYMHQPPPIMMHQPPVLRPPPVLGSSMQVHAPSAGLMQQPLQSSVPGHQPQQQQPQHQQQQQVQQTVLAPTLETMEEQPQDEIMNGVELEEDKPAPEPTLSERMNDLQARSVGCDVEFLVGRAPAVKHIKAHRSVLAAGSKVFENLFFGSAHSVPPMKKRREENLDVLLVEVTDVNSDAFVAVIDYLYSDFKPESINIDENLVLDTLYAARAYGVSQLERACVSMLGDISPPFAVSLMEQAIEHRSDELLQRCYEVIDEQTDDALSADCLPNLKKDTLLKIVSRSELTPSDEITVFRAALTWAEAECGRQKAPVTASSKRQVMGAILNAIRFPTMSVEEFGEAANSGLLTDQEIGILFRYLVSTVRTPINLPFETKERRCLGRSKHVVKRFNVLSTNHCKKQRSSIWFIVNREILITALGIYGIIQSSDADPETKDWETTVDIEIGSSAKNFDVKEHATVQLRGIYGDVRPVLARFKKPVRIAPNIPHRATVEFREQMETYAGGKGVEDIRVHIGGGGSTQETISGGAGARSITPSTTDTAANAVQFAFHNDDPNGIRRGMTRGPAVFTGAVGGFYNRPPQTAAPAISEGCLYEGQIPEIHFLVPSVVKKEDKE